MKRSLAAFAIVVAIGISAVVLAIPRFRDYIRESQSASGGNVKREYVKDAQTGKVVRRRWLGRLLWDIEHLVE